MAANTYSYRQSMTNLLRYVGIEDYGSDHGRLPRRSEEELQRIQAHLPQILEEEEAHRARRAASGGGGEWSTNPKRIPNDIFHAVCDEADRTIFLSFEESSEWKAYLAGTPRHERHQATVKRRLTLSLWRAHCRRTCLWCWFPSEMCFCATLNAQRETLRHRSGECLHRMEVTMLLHAEELMRSTNSGHIAAAILDAPIRIWGVPEDDYYVAQLSQCSRNGHDCTYHLSLYPEQGAPVMEDFVREHVHSTKGAGEGRSGPITGSTNNNNNGSSASVSRVHLLLSDSTWGQALSLNRHIPRAVPRVALVIPSTYASLFAALRKRTRSSGVSTLEATSLAIHQCIVGMGDDVGAEQTAEVLTSSMKEFVDKRCLLKFVDAQFTEDEATVQKIVKQRDAVRKEEALARRAQLDRAVESDAATKALLPPPVLNYCYACDRPIGWHRMAEHVLGKQHRAAVLLNPLMMPTDLARTKMIEEYVRPSWNQRRGSNPPDAEDGQHS